MANKKAQGVVTKSDVSKSTSKPETGAVEKAAPAKVLKRKVAQIRHRVKFGPAPLGKSSTMIQYKGAGLKIDMIDGIYEIPKDIDEKELKDLKKTLEGLGFVDASITTLGELYEEDAPPPRRFMYSVAHPDRAKDGPPMNGRLSVMVKGKPVALGFENGLIRTDDKDLRDALVSGGWIEVLASEILPDKKPEEEKVEEKPEIVEDEPEEEIEKEEGGDNGGES